MNDFTVVFSQEPEAERKFTDVQLAAFSAACVEVTLDPKYDDTPDEKPSLGGGTYPPILGNIYQLRFKVDESTVPLIRAAIDSVSLIVACSIVRPDGTTILSFPSKNLLIDNPTIFLEKGKEQTFVVDSIEVGI